MTHLYSLLWHGTYYYVLARKNSTGEYKVELINGFPAECFSKSLINAAQNRALK